MSKFDIALPVECEICGSADVSVVAAEEAKVMFEFVRDNATERTKGLSMSTMVLSCSDCGMAYELQS
ncbi:hypothetical protein AWB71_02861 [Caballeronia peredens]|nr:hypothetical protein AWB71_02861 [Caballeronia peredens]